MSKLIILGIDPGLAYNGFAVAEVNSERRSVGRVLTLGVRKTTRSKLKTVRATSDDLRRAQEHADHLIHLVKTYRVNAIAMEVTTMTHYKYPTLSFGIMAGVVAALQRPIIEVLPWEIKRVGGSTKRDVIAWALKQTVRQKNLPWPTSSKLNSMGLTYCGKNVMQDAEHAADALAAIQAALLTHHFGLAAAMVSN